MRTIYTLSVARVKTRTRSSSAKENRQRSKRGSARVLPLWAPLQHWALHQTLGSRQPPRQSPHLATLKQRDNNIARTAKIRAMCCAGKTQSAVRP